MSNIKNGKGEIFEATIGPNDGQEWSEAKKAEVLASARVHHTGRSPERIRKNEMLAVRYRMEDYLQNENITPDQLRKLDAFALDFLGVLGIRAGMFAKYIDTDAANLKKYYSGDRKFTIDLAMRFAHFFHTPAELWLMVQVKNDLLLLQQEKETEERYKKYDYEKVLQTA